MGWLEEQIQEREANDDALLRDNLEELAYIVSENKKYSGGPAHSDEAVGKAVEEILKFYGVKPEKTLPKGTDSEKILNSVLETYGLMKRKIKLKGEWYRDAVGPILAQSGDETPTALLPGKLSGYFCRDPATGKNVRVTAKNAGKFQEDAYCFYRAFPSGRMRRKDFTRFLMRATPKNDGVMAVFGILFTAIVGMFLPIATKFIFQNMIPGEQTAALAAIAIFLICMQLSASMMQAVQNAAVSRLEAELNVSLNAAMMGRLLHLKFPFFERYNIGTISGMMEAAESYGSALVETVFSLTTVVLFGIVYMLEISRMASTLALPALAVLAVQLALAAVYCVIDRRVAHRSAEARKKLISNSFALISGVQKIKLAAAEKRAFAKWLAQFKNYVSARYKKPLYLVIAQPINAFIGTAGTALLFLAAKRGGVGVAEYMAFAAAFGILSSSVNSILAQGQRFSELSLYYENFKPILDEEPEGTGVQKTEFRPSGSIEISNVTFRYEGSDSNVLEKFSLNIKKGEYVGIVGRTGCGKSTLVKLLLGFLRPQQGSIFYDGKDLEKLNKTALRRHIGVILQSSALVTGDIYSNIAMVADNLSLEDAWKAAEMADVAEDIRKMPMGMHTIVTEGTGGFSGGQKQRILIARAVAAKPSILIFDEATSALDNVTQKKVAQALDGLHCTRIVIAHRLSTIQKCDRIVVLDEGKIAEEGNYETLMNRNGIFHDLVENQKI